MEHDEHRQQVQTFFEFDHPKLVGNLNEAIYTMNELGLWPDDVEVSEEQVLKCWEVVETMRRKRFPVDLCM